MQFEYLLYNWHHEAERRCIVLFLLMSSWIVSAELKGTFLVYHLWGQWHFSVPTSNDGKSKTNKPCCGKVSFAVARIQCCKSILGIKEIKKKKKIHKEITFFKVEFLILLQKWMNLEIKRENYLFIWLFRLISPSISNVIAAIGCLL